MQERDCKLKRQTQTLRQSKKTDTGIERERQSHREKAVDVFTLLSLLLLVRDELLMERSLKKKVCRMKTVERNVQKNVCGKSM